MKKVFIIMFLALSFSANSQVWIDNGATWHYEYSSIGYGGFEKIEYINDTLIDNKLCNKLVAINYRFTKNQQNEIVFLGQYTRQSNYTYVSGDTVFHLVDGEFYVLYNFGAKPGDSWNIGVDTNMYKCSKSFVKVDSIGTIEINGNTHRWISLSSLPNSSMGLEGKIIERIGAVNHYLFPTERYCDPEIMVSSYIYKFSCFQDISFPLYNVTNKDCEYLLTMGIPELELSVKVYPIPTEDKLYIIRETNSEVMVKIFTTTGELVYSQQLVSNEIDLTNLNNGVYIMRIDETNKSFTSKIVKMNN